MQTLGQVLSHRPLVQAGNPPPAVPRSKLQRIVRQVFSFDMERFKLSVQIAVAITLSSLLVFVAVLRERYPRASWGTATIAFVALDTFGGTFHLSVLRWQVKIK